MGPGRGMLRPRGEITSLHLPRGLLRGGRGRGSSRAEIEIYD